MIVQQTKVELKRAITWQNIILWILIIFPLPIIKFILIREGYVFYRQIEIFLRVNSDFVPLLFPLLMVIVFSPVFIGEQKNNFLIYVNSRVPLGNYLNAKLIANGILSFTVAFLCVYLPFIFILYIEPYLNIVTIYPEDGNSLPLTTFEQFLSLGTFTYGLIYSSWVGLNGLLYGTFGFLLLVLIEKPLIALSTPFIYYLVGSFMTQLLNFDKYSPSSTIFPFSISQQSLWTVLVPFSILLLIVIVLFYKLRRRINRSYE